MKNYLLSTLLAMLAQPSFAQAVDAESIHYKGLDFYNKKSAILHKLGKPDSITQPDYQCGFLSEAEQGKKYYSLHYGKVVFTGNKKEGYLLESIVFDRDVEVQYAASVLTGQTTIDHLKVLFGREWTAEELLNGSMVISFGETSDDGLRIFTENGLLVKIQYWSPC
ncbi:MAG TPA: hypothetical protein VK151_19025 [Fluviicola sp.]|nr:hypothetical protein [Fluviicola sp.]